MTESSDRFLVRTLGLEVASEQRDFGWPYAGQRPRSLWMTARADQGQVRGPVHEIGIVRGQLGIGWQPGERFALEARAGSTHAGRAIPSGELATRFAGGPARELLGEVKASRDAAAWDWVAPAGPALEATQLTGALTYALPTHPALRFSAQGGRRWLSDGNSRDRGELALGYRLSAEPWIVLGWYVEQIAWERAAVPGYYSPASVRSTGPRVEGAFALGASGLSAVGAAQLAWLEERADATGVNLPAEGSGTAVSLALKYGARDAWEARVGVGAQSSVQGGGRWSSESAWLSVSAGF